jgi:hypothetical protein
MAAAIYGAVYTRFHFASREHLAHSSFDRHADVHYRSAPRTHVDAASDGST